MADLLSMRIPNRPPVPEQVSPSCYYGVPTNDETLELLAGSWYLSPSRSLTLSPSQTLTLTLTLNPHPVSYTHLTLPTILLV